MDKRVHQSYRTLTHQVFVLEGEKIATTVSPPNLSVQLTFPQKTASLPISKRVRQDPVY